MMKNLRNIYQERKDKGIIKNYYSKEINKGMSYKAVYFDKIAVILILFFSSVYLFSSITNTLILPIYISLALVFLITRALVNLRTKKQNLKINKVNEELKSRRLMRELSQLNREEFVIYIKGILERYYQSEFTYGEEGIDLIGNIKNKSYAVKCIKSSQEDKIIRSRIEDFHDFINYLDYDEGIIVTNSYFQDGATFDTSLILFDFSGIKEIVKSIDEYPTDEEIKEYIKNRYNDRQKSLEREFKNISVRKIIRLYSVFIILYLVSYFVEYPFYYRIMAIIAFIIATVLGGIIITERVKDRAKIPLHK